MANAGGYVLLHRKLLQSSIWTQLAPSVAKVAVYFLLRANYKRSQWYDGAENVDIPAGSFVTSYARIAAACNISAQQTRDAFSHLSRTQFATYTRTRRWTLVTVLNWHTYQLSQLDGNTPENTHKNTPENTTETTYGTPDKEIKNLRIEKEHQHTPRKNGAAPVNGDVDSSFEEWWKEYPRKDAKPRARAAFKKRVKREILETVMTATRTQRNPGGRLNPDNPRYIPLPATWLNGEEWKNEPTPERKSEWERLSEEADKL